MSKLFSQNVLLYYALPHSLIAGNSSRKGGEVDGGVGIRLV